jgi:hypothetical protein
MTYKAEEDRAMKVKKIKKTKKQRKKIEVIDCPGTMTVFENGDGTEIKRSGYFVFSKSEVCKTCIFSPECRRRIEEFIFDLDEEW